jgi:hypothetical protein
MLIIAILKIDEMIDKPFSMAENAEPSSAVSELLK